MPQTPPQKASEITLGTPKGGIGVVVQGVAPVRPTACNPQMPIWWKARVARKATTKPSNNRVAEAETVSDADRAMTFPPLRARLSCRADPSTITRCASEAYPTRGRPARIDRSAAAVGHERPDASVGHTKTNL